jgi:4-diphosphocytidyl-2-C-methyl-D-erythritol kinase
VITEIAKAKVNLTLRVTGRRTDGYHLLESLVVFPDVGDLLTFEAASSLSLKVVGPEGGGLAGEDNLVLRAAKALQQAFGISAGARITLEKNLPVASGIGGGSADAAAALRGLYALWSLEPGQEGLNDIALTLGADVPVCLQSASANMSGIGEIVELVRGLPAFHIVLVNCRKPVSTPQVFKALKGQESLESASRSMPVSGSFSELVENITPRSNDLEASAIRLEPEIEACLKSLDQCNDVALTRMSGSGATCFGLFEKESEAQSAAVQLRQDHPGWWVKAAKAGP